MTVAGISTLPHHANRPGVGSAEAIVTDPLAPGWCAKRPCNPSLATCLGRGKRGVPCPIQTFVADRQRMLRSWLAVQHLPASVLTEEMRGTISAMRQLMELRE